MYVDKLFSHTLFNSRELSVENYYFNYLRFCVIWLFNQGGKKVLRKRKSNRI
jgi:hypothetical protein